MGYVIRTATPDDAEALGAVNVQSWRETYNHFLSPAFLAALSIEKMVDKYRQWLAHEGAPLIHVAEVDDAVVGYAAAGRRSYRRNGFEFDGTRDVAEQWENLAEVRMVR